jgi:hypothetical protein
MFVTVGTGIVRNRVKEVGSARVEGEPFKSAVVQWYVATTNAHTEKFTSLQM